MEKNSGNGFFQSGCQDPGSKIKKKVKKNKEVINAILNMGEVSVHSSQTYHSSLGNKEKKPRVGMVVHFRTDKSKQIELKGKENDYLDQIKDASIAPIIYQEKT